MTIQTLRPNFPGARTIAEGRPYTVQGPALYPLTVTAEYNDDTDAVNVHVGGILLPLDYVGWDETVWECITRMVEEWQADTLESDHTEALAENEVLSTVPRYIAYMHVPFGHTGELMGFNSVRAVRDYFADSDYDNASVYACLFDVDMWRSALEYRETGCPFDYPTYVMDRGPRGGVVVERA